jgi:sugar lactone lactonase YvrE
MNNPDSFQPAPENKPRQRPVLVVILTIIVVMDALGEGCSALGTLIGKTSSLVVMLTSVLTLGVIMALLVLAWGLWQLKNWARIGLMVLIVLNYILGVPKLISDASGNAALAIGFLVLALLLRGVIVFWLANNGSVFQQGDGPIVNQQSASGRKDYRPQFLIGLGCATLLGILVLGVFIIAGVYNRPRPTPHISYNPPLTTPTPIPQGFEHVAFQFDVQGVEVPGGASTLKYPSRLAVDQQGNIYLIGTETLHVFKYDPAGKYLGGFDLDPKKCQRLSSMDNLDMDAHDELFIHCGFAILKYDVASGKFMASYDASKDGRYAFYDNMAVAADGSLMVLEEDTKAHQNNLVLLDPAGKQLHRYVDFMKSVTPALTNPVGILFPALDTKGNIYFLDISSLTVFKFGPDGKFLSALDPTVWGPKPNPNARGSMGYLPAIAVDAQGRLFVTDPSHLKVFGADGKYIDSMDITFMNGAQQMIAGSENTLYMLSLGTHYMRSGDSEVYRLVWAGQ